MSTTTPHDDDPSMDVTKSFPSPATNPSSAESATNKDPSNATSSKTNEVADTGAIETIISAPESSPAVMETWIQGSYDLEGTHGETSLKPSSGTSQTTKTLNISRVSLRQRDLTAGRRSGDAAEFEIGMQLGKGGMGAVYAARQSALDRTVAIKLIKPDIRNDSAKEQFVAEAIITGDLEHPGIVPIYDLGVNARGEVFYAMKEVRGDSWKKLMDQKSESENVEILLRVADAIAFAHARGVLHRDLKPDNVMIGEFGEVLVMDWGLALPMQGFSKPDIPFATGMAGTPSYMAPEMADADMQRIGVCSDIYLLGALLFRILTGRSPHTGSNALECLKAASRNELVPTDRDDALMAIAKQAMATNPADRYPSVKEFQAAIREYEQHAESYRLTEHGEKELQAAQEQGNYRKFERAIAAFEDASRLWQQNQRAQSGSRAAQLAYGEIAFRKGDFDLAAQQLDPLEESHRELLKLVQLAQTERDTRLARLKLLRQWVIALTVLGLAILSISSFIVHRSWRSEEAAHSEALQRFRESHQAIEQLTAIGRELEYAPRMQGVRANLLKTVARYFEELNEKRSNDPGMQLEQAAALLQLGDVYALLAEHSKAHATYESANASAHSVLSNPQSQLRDAAHLLLAKIELKRAQSELALKELTAADAALERAQQHALHGDSPHHDALRADIDFQRVRLELAKGDRDAANALLVKTLSLYEKAATASDGGLRLGCRFGMASVFDLQAQLAEQAGQLGKAERSVLLAIEVWDDLYTTKPDVPSYLEGLATSRVLLSNVLHASGHDAIPQAREAIKAYVALTNARPEVPRYAFNLASEQANLAYWLLQTYELDEAQAVAVSAVSGFVKLSNDYPEEVDYADGEASGRSVLGEILRDRGEYQLSADVLTEAIKHFEQRVTEFARQPYYRERLVENLSLHALTLQRLDQRDAAKTEFERALAMADELIKDDSEAPRPKSLAAWLHQHLADDATARDDSDNAQKHVKAVLALREKLPRTAQYLSDFSWSLLYGLRPESRDSKRAVGLLTEVTQIAPANGDYWFDLAVAQALSRAVDDATKSVESAAALQPQPTGQAELIKALIARKEGRTEAADQLHKQGLEQFQQRCPGNLRLQRLADLR